MCMAIMLKFIWMEGEGSVRWDWLVLLLSPKVKRSLLTMCWKYKMGGQKEASLLRKFKRKVQEQQKLKMKEEMGCLSILLIFLNFFINILLI